MTGHEPEVALVLSADEWVDTLHRHCADHGGARVRCLVLDPAVALDEEFDVLVTSDRWPALTRPFVDALHERGRRVLAVGDPEHGADLARRLGVDRVVTATLPPTGVVDAVVALAGGADRRDAAVASSAPDRARPGDPSSGFVVVGGPRGAGSSEVALALAGRCVRAGTRPVLMDADPVAPSVAVRLGLPLEPNVCSAVDAVVFGLGAVPGALFDLGEGWPVVLVGAPSRRTGAALAGRDLVAVADVLGERFAPVIVDVSAGSGSVDGRDDPWSALVARARLVVAVGAATPVAVVGLSGWIDDVRAVAPTAPVYVVVNRAPTARSRRAEIAAELQRDARLGGVTFLPSDPRVDDAAWAASLVERGPFVRAVEPVGRAVLADLSVGGSSIGGR